jgi:hypothetical protein
MRISSLKMLRHELDVAQWPSRKALATFSPKCSASKQKSTYDPFEQQKAKENCWKYPVHVAPSRKQAPRKKTSRKKGHQ